MEVLHTIPIELEVRLLMFALMAGLTHGLVGFVAAYIIYPKGNPWWGFLGGAIIDIDNVFMFVEWGYPWVHRGIVHTPFMMFFTVSILMLLGYTRTETVPFMIGWFFHLLTDTFTQYHLGIPWFWPFVEETYNYDIFGYWLHSFEVEPIVWISAILLSYIVYFFRRQTLDWIVD